MYSPFFPSSKCSLFRNSNVFGSCIIHILYTGVLKLHMLKLYFIYLFNKYRYSLFQTWYILSVFSSSKCSLFHNYNIFGSCIIHTLYTGCAKIKKKNNSGSKRLYQLRQSVCILLYLLTRVCHSA